MKAYGGMNVQRHAFLTYAIAGGDCEPHVPAALPSGKEHVVPAQLQAGWGQSRSGQIGEENIPLFLQDAVPGRVDSGAFILIDVLSEAVWLFVKRKPTETK